MSEGTVRGGQEALELVAPLSGWDPEKSQALTWGAVGSTHSFTVIEAASSFSRKADLHSGGCRVAG